jgi:hypothetical protein
MDEFCEYHIYIHAYGHRIFSFYVYRLQEVKTS